MSRLIDAEALKKAFKETVCIEPMPYAFVKQIIDNAPTVEALTYTDIIEANKEGYNTARRLYERPQGEWVDVEGSAHLSACKRCGHEIDRRIEEGYPNFCAECGADMRQD